MSKRTWFVFAFVQIVGGVLASHGTVYSESSFVRWSWAFGVILLLPGNFPALLLADRFIHVPNGYIFFPIALTVNALVWVGSAALFRKVRRLMASSSIPQ